VADTKALRRVFFFDKSLENQLEAAWVILESGPLLASSIRILRKERRADSFFGTTQEAFSLVAASRILRFQYTPPLRIPLCAKRAASSFNEKSG